MFDRELAELSVIEEDSNEAKNYANYNNYTSKNYPERNYPERNYPEKAHEDFLFDPNTATAEEWKRLGIREKTAATIHRYLLKGGKFRNAEDISKIWGLHPDEIKRLIPLVRIQQLAEAEKKEFVPSHYERPKEKIISINTADTNALIALPGIGSKLAKRILNFRDKLGGFVSINQVGETFGLPDSTFQKIKKYLVADASIRLININSCTVDELKAHPYLRYYLANAIVQYRIQHGNYEEVGDIKKILIMTDSVYLKIYPYLTVK